jgi:hypothetical protein
VSMAGVGVQRRADARHASCPQGSHKCDVQRRTGRFESVAQPDAFRRSFDEFATVKLARRAPFSADLRRCRHSFASISLVWASCYGHSRAVWLSWRSTPRRLPSAGLRSWSARSPPPWRRPLRGAWVVSSAPGWSRSQFQTRARQSRRCAAPTQAPSTRWLCARGALLRRCVVGARVRA